MTAPDLNGRGTPERDWQASGLPDGLPVLDWEVLGGASRVVVIAPHPDDEILGVGGILGRLSDELVPVLVIAVTDGENSHPGQHERLRERRAAERTTALRELGSSARVVRLALPDGAVDATVLRAALSPLIAAGDVVLAPWEHDGHPDHDACGRAVRGLGSARWSYVVWGWHWTSPTSFPQDRARRVTMGADLHRRKRRAVTAFRSQLEGPQPILPPHVRIRLLRTTEALLSEAS